MVLIRSMWDHLTLSFSPSHIMAYREYSVSGTLMLDYELLIVGIGVVCHYGVQAMTRRVTVLRSSASLVSPRDTWAMYR